jgi:lipooligosaccharide transport system ATP-binding protein
MDGGRFVAEGSPRELIGNYATPEVLELRFPLDDHVAAGAKLLAAAGQAANGDGIGERIEVLADRILI